MKLLVITQKVDRDDAVLGFFHRWVEEFAKHCEKITVICLGQGEYQLPANVRVLSLGKEKSHSKLKYVFNFYKYLWQERKNYNTVFVHMNPIYIVLAGWYWRLTGRRIGLWYTHRQVDLKLRVAEKFTNLVFSAAAESFKLSSHKLRVVGHGIDTEAFACSPRRDFDPKNITIFHVGRVSKIKNCDVLIETARLLRDKNKIGFKLVFIGDPMTVEDCLYKSKLLDQIIEAKLEGLIEFRGSVANREMPAQYCQADLTVNLTPTGGIDKSVLESMAAGVPVFTSNQAFRNYFGEYTDRLVFLERGADDLAQKIMTLILSDDQKIGDNLHRLVVEKSDIRGLIKRIIGYLS